MLQELLKGRGAILELLAAAFLMALGVNFLSSATASLVGLGQWSLLSVGVGVVVVALLILVRKILASRHVERTIDGLFVYDKKKSQLVRIDRYQLSEALSKYLKGLFAENVAAEKLWKSDPLSKQVETDTKTGEFRLRVAESTRLIREAVEYFVLDQLSTHLADYFNKPTFEPTQLRTFGREDVPSVLFRNRFLDTFSRSMADRPAFVDHVIGKKALPGRIVTAFEPKGGLYERFDLVLPVKATVARIADNQIKISTPKFDLTVESVYDGYGAVLPARFEAGYLGLVSYDDYATYEVKVRVFVTFRAAAMFTRVGWEYYMWLDSFLESLEEKFGSDRFLQRIAWEQAATILDVLDDRGGSTSVRSI